MKDIVRIPKCFLDLTNQIFEIEKKVGLLQEANSIQRNINRLKEILEIELLNSRDGEPKGIVFHNPINEPYDETRTDCDASIAGTSTRSLIITEVIKPIIRYRQGGINLIVQKAVVIVESKKL